MSASNNNRLIDRWFPCAAVDVAVRTTAGSAKNEKAIFTWFASRPIAQARAAVLCALLPDEHDLHPLVDAAVRTGDRSAISGLAKSIAALRPGTSPVVLDIFSGRGIIPLEAARFGATTVGLDLSPVATLAGRVLADYPLRNWPREPPAPFDRRSTDGSLLSSPEPQMVSDLRALLLDIGRRVQHAVKPYYPRNPDSSFPWGYLWAITMPCDGCQRRFPLVGSLTLRHPCRRTGDPGQAFRILTDGDQWVPEVFDGVPDQTPTYSSLSGRKGKSARCSFCGHVHSLESVKAKGFGGEYQDIPLFAADTAGETKKVFRALREDELKAAMNVELVDLAYDGSLSAVPEEPIPLGNVHTIQASGYGYRTYGELMCDRQTLHFIELVRVIRSCHREMLDAGLSADYATALTSFACATLVRKLKYSTRGATLQPNGNLDGSDANWIAVRHVYSNEASVAFQFDYFETGPGSGPGTWASLSETGLKPYATHFQGLRGRPARFRQGNAMALPYRDGSVDAVITDPPYDDMIEYADASDLFHVWLKRALFDIQPDLFNGGGLQNKDDEIIVRRVHAGGVRHDKDFYQRSMARAFAEAKRVLRPDGHLVVVFGHSDPDGWKHLLGALHQAGFVVTSSWPSRTEAGSTKVASIKVTITIGCRVAATRRPAATSAQVDREVVEAVKARVSGWTSDGLALADQLMAAYGPAMEVYGRYAKVLQPDGETVPLDRYLTLARTAVRDAVALRLDQIPLETFDALTRFAVFWMRLYGRTNVPKGRGPVPGPGRQSAT